MGDKNVRDHKQSFIGICEGKGHVEHCNVRPFFYVLRMTTFSVVQPPPLHFHHSCIKPSTPPFAHFIQKPCVACHFNSLHAEEGPLTKQNNYLYPR